MDFFDIMDRISEADLERAFANMTLEQKIRFIEGLEALHHGKAAPHGAD